MSAWRIWAVTVPLIVIMIAVGTVLWLWRNLTSNWSAETSAAQYVLDHSPIDHLQNYEVFTASGLQDVFRGSDAFHQEWYAFYVPQANKAYVVSAKGVIPQSKAAAVASQNGITPDSETLGYVTSAASGVLHPKDHVVYEVVGTKDEKSMFVYIDAVNGKVLWKY